MRARRRNLYLKVKDDVNWTINRKRSENCVTKNGDREAKIRLIKEQLPPHQPHRHSKNKVQHSPLHLPTCRTGDQAIQSFERWKLHVHTRLTWHGWLVWLINIDTEMMKGKLSTIVIYIDGLCVSGGCLNLRSGVFFSIGESAPNRKEKRIAWSQVSAASKGMAFALFRSENWCRLWPCILDWNNGYGFRGN